MKLVSSKKVIGAITLAGTMLLVGIIGFAQQSSTQGQGGQERGGRNWHGGGGKGEGRGMRGGMGGGMFEKLNLTDAQKEQMKQIAARYHESFKAQRQPGGERRGGGGFDALNGGTFNEAAVRAAAQARANAQVEMEVARAHMMFEMYNVLTAEQKAQLAAERQQWEQKRQERRANRQANPVQNQ
ncbi:MAG: motif family protein [Acidobacteriota bacterium]|jgi:protein CpxP|nr:motif family protein [Acidobacteriota bacterium]